MSSKRFKKYLLLITFAIVLYFFMNNFGIFWNILGFIMIVIMPFIVGFCFAYIINKPYAFFADKAYAGMANKGKFLQKLRKPLAMITAYIIVFGIIVFLIVILVPQLVSSFEQLIQNFSGYADSFKSLIIQFSDKWLNGAVPADSNLFQILNSLVEMVTGGEMKAFIQNAASYFGPGLFDFTVSFTTNLYNVGMGIVISFYLLACKDKLLYQSRKLVYAYVPEKILPKVLDIANLSDKMFGRYIYGRILDSLIIGIMCFIGMSIFRFDYALLISVIIGITNIIPVFGPFMGAVPSVLIMLIINPMEAVWFTIFIVVLQQIDGNIIGPKILGSSIGISGFWIMTSVVIGGGLFGIIGMFVAVPVFSIIYFLLGENVNKRVAKSTHFAEIGNEPNSDIMSGQRKKPYDFKKSSLYKIITKNVREDKENTQNKKDDDESTKK